MENLKRFIVRDKESGNIIDSFSELLSAQDWVQYSENWDKKVGTYTPDFYEVYDNELKEIIS